MNNQAAGWVIVILVVLLVISYAHKVVVHYKKKKGRHHPPHNPCPPCPDCPPRVTGLKIDSISVNNNSIILKGKKMSVSLVGKQQVVYNVIPLTTDPGTGAQTPIDLTLWTLDQLFVPGSIQASVSDLSIVTETQDTTNPLLVTVTSVDGANGTAILTVIGQALNGQIVSATDDITVTPVETTTSTSTSTTTTEAPPTAPLVSGLGLQAGTPTDVV